MSTAMAEPTLRKRIEVVLHKHTGRDVALTRIYELLPDCNVLQVRRTIKNLLKRGTVIRHGTTRYPAYQVVRPVESAPAQVVQALAAKPAAAVRPAVTVTWPADLQVQHWPAPTRHMAPFEGVDWSRSALRPGCQDHLLVPSRRGDVRVTHRPPIGTRGAMRRKENA